MVDIIEVKRWDSLNLAFVVDVKSLEDLTRIAEGLGVPFILRKGKEHMVFCGHMGPAPLCYRLKK